ncbi:hypothetical protein [Nocardia macrotermitis]|uniref:DUF8020 domain-containing protein n=1 Tax=Nocardia macrotermitis TaxID=2585198 RepID=A0A7K0D5Y6_9NOCA|nr:hypothetical protein [Nocardia macrotermitis]MQY20971.1 hypothetical protein [Nocardia macrotermitis]
MNPGIPAGLLRTALAGVAAAGAIAAAAVPAHAEPAAAPRLQAAISGDSVVTRVVGATFALDNDRHEVRILDAQNKQLASLPLTFQVNDRPFKIAEQISGDARTLTLTPDVQAVRRAGFRPVASAVPVASPMEDQVALNHLSADLNLGIGVGGFGGALVGAAVGAVIGLGSCLVVGPVCLATAPAAIGAFAAAGGVAGTLVGGGAALAEAGWKYILTLQAAPGKSPYAGQDGLLDPNGTGVPDAQFRLPPGLGKSLMSGSG